MIQQLSVRGMQLLLDRHHDDSSCEPAGSVSFSVCESLLRVAQEYCVLMMVLGFLNARINL